MRRLSPSAWLVVAALISLWVLGASDTSAQTLDPAVEQELALVTYDLQELLLPASDPGEFLVFLTLGNDDYVLELKRHSMRADGFQVLVQGETGVLERAEVERPRTYRGTARGPQRGEVAATLLNGQLFAAVVLDGDEQWWVQPVEEATSATSGLHAVYQPSGVQLDELYRCATDELPREIDQPGQDDSSTQVTGNEVCEVAFDADREFFQKNGSSVSQTVFDIERVMNVTEHIYERDTQITYEMTTIVVRTAEPDPYGTTDPGSLLSQFRSHWNNNFGFIRRDTAHLMTGKNLNGGVIGIAYVGVICFRSSAYGVSESRFTTNFNSRVGLTAHELGHNWNAGHCNGNGDCHIMCSGLGGCNGLGQPNFGGPSANTIRNYRNSRSCLFNEPDPGVIPFHESFPVTALDTNAWTWNQGTQINANGSNEPTGPNALNLDAATAGEYRDDEIRSGFFDLVGKKDMMLSFFSQHQGVPAGNDLVAEYWGGAGVYEWLELVRVSSDGSNPSSFDFHEVALPFLVNHPEFRLRFRTEVDGTSEDWYVDDVFLRQVPELVETTPPSPGQIATAEVRNLTPGESVTLLFSLTGIGNQTCLFGGALCLDLNSPFFVVPGAVPADGSGIATFNVNVPTSAPVGLNLWFQAVVLRNPNKLSDSSNTLATSIQ